MKRRIFPIRDFSKMTRRSINFIESVEVTDDEETVSLKLKIGYRLFPIIKVVV